MISRWKKNQEFYIVRMYQDLLGDWIVTQSWGNAALDICSCRHNVASSYDEARKFVRKLSKQRKADGFRRLARQETQLGFDFFLSHESSPSSVDATVPTVQP